MSAGRGQDWCSIGEHAIPSDAASYGDGDGTGDGHEGRFACALCWEARRLGRAHGARVCLDALTMTDAAFAREFCDSCGRMYSEDAEQEECAGLHYAIQQVRAALRLAGRIP